MLANTQEGSILIEYSYNEKLRIFQGKKKERKGKERKERGEKRERKTVLEFWNNSRSGVIALGLRSGTWRGNRRLRVGCL